MINTLEKYMSTEMEMCDLTKAFIAIHQDYPRVVNQGVQES